MKASKLVLRSLVFYRRTHLGVLIGATIATAILVGALVVGDSVRYSLQQLTFARLGTTEYALSGGERLFRSALADDLAAALDTRVAPVLQLAGIAIAEGGERRANQVQVLGVDERFRAIGSSTKPLFPGDGEQALVNQRLADRLGLAAGDELLLRIEKADQIPGDVPLTSRDSTSVALRLTVAAVATTEQLERFGLRPNQVSPLSVFLPLQTLGRSMDLAGRANILLVAERPGKKPLSAEELATTLSETWQLADAGLRLRRLSDEQTGEQLKKLAATAKSAKTAKKMLLERQEPGLELVSDRVFLDPPVEKAALAVPEPSRGIITYFVNLIGSTTGSTPYSFVAAPGPPLVPEGMAGDEIIINRWVADDIDAGVGDRLHLAYFVPGSGFKLVQKVATFTVRSIVPISGAAADRSLMPMFPGLSDADSCRDWDPGIPIDLERIRDKDEEYWDTYRGTPKAFVTAAAARELWSNRFGTLTAVRYPEAVSRQELATAILQQLDPASLGLVFVPVREQGMTAGSQAVDFSGLFIGLSFFIIVAALLLTGLLFVLGVEQRSAESGLLRALGYTAKQVQRLVLVEGSVLALLGGLAGTACGVVYNRVVLALLGTVWRGAVGTTRLTPHVEGRTLVIGVLIGVLMAVVAMLLAVRRQSRRSPTELLGAVNRIPDGHRVHGRRSLVVAGLCLVGVLVILAAMGPGKGKEAANAFWGAGSLMLIGTLALCHAWLARLDLGRGAAQRVGIGALGVRNAARKRRRSLTTVALLASGVFLVVATAANRYDPSAADGECRDSGTGGFSFYGETTLPVQQDLNSKKARTTLDLDEEQSGVSFVQLRLRAGDDASCLNLNRTTQPTILGVRPQELSVRCAFSFAKLADGIDANDPWPALDVAQEDGTIPAVADQAVIVWGLGKKVGDTLSYTDEHGQEIRLKLIGGLTNSIFQGNVLISEQAFLEHFPSVSGSRVLLVDTPPDKESRDKVGTILSRSLQDYGLELTPAEERLAEFNRVQNTYLTIFLALGGLGLVLGTVGMGVIVLRDIMEQRGELALLRAVGFSRSALQRLLLSEYALVLVAGVVCGTLSALVAVLPALLSPGSEIPYGFIAVTLLAIAGSGALWILATTRLATRGELVPALRNE